MAAKEVEEEVVEQWHCPACDCHATMQYLVCPTCGSPKPVDVPAALDSDVTSDSPEMPESPASGTGPQAPDRNESVMGDAKSK